MPRKKINFKYADYVRVTKPDLNVISELVKRAKGTRKLSDFAKLCDISLATMSLIVNGKARSPLSDALVRAISENADPESNVTEEVLLEANGMAKKETRRSSVIELSKANVERVEDCVRFGAFFETTAKELIAAALLKNGYTISQKKENDVFVAPFAKLRPDFEFCTNAFEEEGIALWCFDTMLTNNADNADKLFNKIAVIFSVAYMDSLKESGIKFSFVIDSEMIFNEIKCFFEKRRINDVISIILIDVAKRKIVDEFTIPTTFCEKIKHTLL